MQISVSKIPDLFKKRVDTVKLYSDFLKKNPEFESFSFIWEQQIPLFINEDCPWSGGTATEMDQYYQKTIHNIVKREGLKFRFDKEGFTILL